MTLPVAVNRLLQRGLVRWTAIAFTLMLTLGTIAATLTWGTADGHSSQVRAAHAGLFGTIDFTPDGTQPGLSSVIDPPSQCESCHRNHNPEAPQASDYMPHNSWGGSMMAHATRDPLFWAALDVANADVPGVGDYCLRCHTPTGWLEGRVRKTGTGGLVDGADGCLLGGNHVAFENKGNDYAGLTCGFCHRLTETGPAGEVAGQGNGNFWVDDSANCVTPDGSSYSGPCRHGPYQYPEGSMLTPPHGWVYSTFLDRGGVCGTCHDVSTPDTSEGPLKTLILADGSDSGIPMPIERTFTEWQQSDFSDVIFRDRLGDDFAFQPQLARGATCQDCHMAKSEDPTAKACSMHLEGSRADDLPVHEFVGGNTWIPAVLLGEYGDELAQFGGRDEDLERTIVRAKRMLTERSALIETTVQPYVAGSNQLVASVRLTNLTGHKLPTGYAEGRRMWLHVAAHVAGQPEPIWESGGWNPDTGALQDDAQVKVYETTQGIWNAGTQACEIEDSLGRKQFHFVLNNCIVKDNRIPPLGFAGGTHLETRPVGHVYPAIGTDPDRLVNYDVTGYVIPVPPGTSGQVTVTATLKFQVASDDYINFLKNQAVERNFQAENLMCSGGPGRPFDVGPQDKTRGQFMHDLWSNPEYGRSPPEDMVSANAVVALP